MRQLFGHVRAWSLGLACTLALTTPASHAQGDWPSKPVRAIVSFPAGGATDNLARAFAKELSDSLGQQFVVDNRGGAAGSIGTDAVAKAAADGYTLLFGPANPLTIVPHLRKTPYTLDDLVPIARLGTYVAGVAVRKSLGIDSMKEFVALATRDPGKLTFGSSGIGGMSHIRLEALKAAAGIKVVHVPYKGGAELLQDLMGERIDMMIENLFFPQVKQGQVKMIAVVGDRRLPDFPSIPTVAEAGFPEMNTPGTFAIFAPRGVSQAIVSKLNAAVIQIAQTPAMQRRMMDLGFMMEFDTSEELGRKIRDEYALYGRIVRAAGIEGQ